MLTGAERRATFEFGGYIRTGGGSETMEADEGVKHRTRVRVRYSETDQMGVVHHANYLIWMEVGRVELVRSRGVNYKDLEQSEGLYLSVVDVACRYLRPARYDQEITVETEVAKSNTRIVEFRYAMRLEETGELLAQGSSKHVWLNREWRLTKLPEQYQHLLRVG